MTGTKIDPPLTWTILAGAPIFESEAAFVGKDVAGNVHLAGYLEGNDGLVDDQRLTEDPPEGLRPSVTWWLPASAWHPASPPGWR